VLREECRQLRTEAAAREEQLRRLAARLARTEEAAKRALVASNPDARGGVAAQLLAAEHEVNAGRSALLALRRQLVAATKAATRHLQRADELAARLRGAQADVRQLVMRVGRLERRTGASAAAPRRNSDDDSTLAAHAVAALDASLCENLRLATAAAAGGTAAAGDDGN
jgi:hypothetical protein